MPAKDTRAPSTIGSGASKEAPATNEAVEGFYRHWEEAMTACGVHDPAKPKNLMSITRRLFSRANLTQTEIDLLRGICAAVIRPKRDRAGSKKPSGGTDV